MLFFFIVFMPVTAKKSKEVPKNMYVAILIKLNKKDLSRFPM